MWCEADLWSCEVDVRAREKTSEVMLHVLEDEMDVAREFWSNQTLEFDNVGMIKSPKYQNLSSHEPNTLWLKIVEPNLLQSHYLPCFGLSCTEHATVCPLSDLQTSEETKQSNCQTQNNKELLEVISSTGADSGYCISSRSSSNH